MAVGTIVIAVVVMSAYLLTWFVVRRSFFARHELIKRRQALNEQMEGLRREDRLRLVALWTNNQERIDIYQEIATKQSRESFRNGQAAILIGFWFVLLIGMFAAFSSNGTAAIAASVIGVAGAALSGFIGHTFLRSQAEASKQLRQYYEQPLDLARILSAERLLEMIDVPDRGPVVAKMVENLTACLPTNDEDRSEK